MKIRIYFLRPNCGGLVDRYGKEGIIGYSSTKMLGYEKTQSWKNRMAEGSVGFVFGPRFIRGIIICVVRQDSVFRTLSILLHEICHTFVRLIYGKGVVGERIQQWIDEFTEWITNAVNRNLPVRRNDRLYNTWV